MRERVPKCILLPTDDPEHVILSLRIQIYLIPTHHCKLGHCVDGGSSENIVGHGKNG